MTLRYALNTNILLRLSIRNRNHPQHELIQMAMRRLLERDVESCYTAQNLGELWNVSMRAPENNGFGLTIDETEAHVRSIERALTFLPDSERANQRWRRMLLFHRVRGVQVHDAHLAAVLESHGVANLLTFNTEDFKRYTSLTAVRPEEVQESL